MKIKETIYTEIDNRGRVTRRTRTVDIDDSDMNYGYDHATRYGERDCPRQASFSRIMEAYDDYCRCKEW